MVELGMATHEHSAHGDGPSLNRLAVSATALAWSNGATIAASIALAFLLGYSLTSLPLLRAGLGLRRTAPLAFASDTLSITTMEIVDTLIVVLIPGALAAGL